MKRSEEWEQLKNEYQTIRMPKDGVKKMQDAIVRAKADKKRERRKHMARNFGIGAAAAVLILVALPNMNRNIAYAMGNLPVIGNFFRVITVREYTYDDGDNIANVDIPMIVQDDTPGVGNDKAITQLNKSVEEYVEELIVQFEEDMQTEGYKELDVSYEIVTDTADWFALKVTGLEVMASGYEFHRYYNIDKKQGEVVQLKDLFAEGADYVTPISDEIKRQMREQMEEDPAMYFLDNEELEDNFETIKEEQNFYLEADGTLVIVFDEYEVGPGYIGSPAFTIPAEIVAGIRK